MNQSQPDDKLIDKALVELDPLTLGEWEAKFVANVKTWWVQKRKLSDKQAARLLEIWRKQNAEPR